jgi:hypothetical protein
MRKVVRLTESDLARIVKRVIKEQSSDDKYLNQVRTQPSVGSSLSVYKDKNVKENFTGNVCRTDGKYLYLKSLTTGKCAEYLWNPSGLRVRKSGNSYDIMDPSFNIIPQDCLRACKTR